MALLILPATKAFMNVVFCHLSYEIHVLQFEDSSTEQLHYRYWRCNVNYRLCLFFLHMHPTSCEYMLVLAWTTWLISAFINYAILLASSHNGCLITVNICSLCQLDPNDVRVKRRWYHLCTKQRARKAGIIELKYVYWIKLYPMRVRM